MDTELLEKPKTQKKAERLRDLILHNDDVNTFDFVIETLVEICEHNLLQAEQCAHIVHYNGKCAVKKGSYDDLEPLCLELLKRGLSATID
jgi:ATP-dependent Clp protease adaptor protein ClpS